MMRRRRLRVVALALVFALGAVVLAGGLFYRDQIHQRHRVGQGPVSLTIPPGTSVSGVADILHKQGLIDNTLVFQVYVRYHGYNSALEAGHYQVPGGLDTVGLVELMRHARGNEVSVTIPEGYTSKQIADLMQQKGLFATTAYMAAVQGGDFKQDFLATRPAGAGFEGFLFPDTYSFAPKATPADVINAQLNRFGEVVTADLRSHAADQKVTLYQAVVLASIVEREGKFDADRGQIAAVFYNRLAAGMPLQSDVTVAFAKGDPGSAITESDKAIQSPYNTYLNKGLPPGPICNPGLASIVAALTPAQNDYLYFLTDKDGHAHFSRTLAEHQQQIIQYGVQ